MHHFDLRTQETETKKVLLLLFVQDMSNACTAAFDIVLRLPATKASLLVGGS